MSSPLRFARGSDRWMRKRGPVAAAMRFATSLPGQILVNTAAFTLPEELRIHPSWRVLDIGCGRAGLIRILADRVGLQTPPVGLDASQPLLQLARRDIAVEGGPAARLSRGVATALPFADETFDLLLAAHTFKYLTDDELRSCLVEARRVLKPGGLFLAWEFAPTSSERLDRWNRRVLTLELPLVRLRAYRELETLARDCGFEWVEHARLRPFLLPPIPRCSLIMGKAPRSWHETTTETPFRLEAPAAGSET